LELENLVGRVPETLIEMVPRCCSEGCRAILEERLLFHRYSNQVGFGEALLRQAPRPMIPNKTHHLGSRRAQMRMKFLKHPRDDIHASMEMKICGS
jgi:hypothetical protein